MNVIKKGPRIRNKISNMLDGYSRLPEKNQSKIGYDALIRNVILKQLINIMGTTITVSDIKVKMKISRVNYLESRLF